MSTTYHASFWYPRASQLNVLENVFKGLSLSGFGLRDPSGNCQLTLPDKYRRELRPETGTSFPEGSLVMEVVHAASDADVFVTVMNFRVPEGDAVRVDISAQEPQFRRDRELVMGLITSTQVLYEAALVTFYELSQAHYGYVGAGNVGLWDPEHLWDETQGVSYQKGRAMEASSVLRDEIPFLENSVNFVPKAMYSKFGRPLTDLKQYEQRVRILELRSESVLLAFSDCLTTETRADHRRFAADFAITFPRPLR